MTTKTKPRTRLTAKQEAFCVNYVHLNNGKLAAVKAGYPEGTAKVIATQNLTKLYLQERIAEIRANLPPDPDISTVEERKRRLTEFHRADLVDFITPEGIKIDKQSPNVGAVSEITTKTKVFRKGGEPVNITTLKLRDPIAAIAELNKMEHIYEVGGNIRDVNVVFVIGKGYANQPQLMEGSEEDGKLS